MEQVNNQNKWQPADVVLTSAALGMLGVALHQVVTQQLSWTRFAVAEGLLGGSALAAGKFKYELMKPRETSPEQFRNNRLHELRRGVQESEIFSHSQYPETARQTKVFARMECLDPTADGGKNHMVELESTTVNPAQVKGTMLQQIDQLREWSNWQTGSNYRVSVIAVTLNGERTFSKEAVTHIGYTCGSGREHYGWGPSAVPSQQAKQNMTWGVYPHMQGNILDDDGNFYDNVKEHLTPLY